MSMKSETIINKIYLITIIILLILAIGSTILIYRLDYTAGTRNDAFGSLNCFGLSLVFFFIMANIALCSSIFAIISLIIKHKNISHVLLKLGLILVGPFIVYCAFDFLAPMADIYLKGLAQWAQNEVDIDSIQQWLQVEGPNYYGQYIDSEEDLPEELRKYLPEIDNMSVSFYNLSSKNGYKIEITWFLFMDECGMIIGSPDMETPEKGHIELEKSLYEFRHPVKQGAYVFIRG